MSEPSFSLRPATAADMPAIRQLIRIGRINPLSLDWRRFTLAVTSEDAVIGCGQIKPHSDGTRELASIAVLPEYRQQKIATTIIQHLLENHPGELYLTCRSRLETFYQPFGFSVLPDSALPPYFARIKRLAALFRRINRQEDKLLVMYRGAAKS